MTGDLAPTPASRQIGPDHSTRYESLRVHAVQRHASSSRDGLVVMLRQGVAGWLEAWSTLPAAAPAPMQPERRRASPLPDDASAEVVRVLAAMTLSHIEEVRA